MSICIWGKRYFNKYLQYEFEIFRACSIEPGLCDELKELNCIKILQF